MALHHMLRAAAAQQNAAPSDPYFYDVSLLLTGDGTNGAQNNTFLDSSTNNFTITRNGNTTQGTFSPYGSLWSNYFDGSGAAFSISDNAAFNLSTGAFTIEAWVNNSSLSGYQTIISKRAAVWEMGLSNNQFYWWVGSTVYTTTATISKGQWTHVAVSSDGTNVKLFVNGTLDSTVSGATPGSGAGSIYVGYAGSGQYFPGYISNLRVVKGTQLYTTTFTPSTTPLTAVSGTSLLTCQSNRFKDNSSNNFTLTVNGTPSVQRFSPFNPTAPYSAATIGGSGYFDGSGDYLSVSTASGSGDLTMEFWVYPTTSISSGNYGLFSASDQRFGMITVSGNLYFLAASDINTSTPLPINTWSHVAISKNSGTIKIFLNGVQIASASNSNTATGNWRIASNQSGEIFPACYMSDVRYIVGTGLYTTAFTPPTTPLTAITNTSLLCNFTNAGIPDAAMMNDLETVGNAQVSTSVKKYGTGSLAFDGTGDWLTMPYKPSIDLSAGDWTVEGWVYVSSLASARDVITVNGNSGTYGNVRIVVNANGSLYLLCATASNVWISTSVTSAGLVTTGAWYHVAGVRNGSTFTLYVNGTSALTYTSSSALYNNSGTTYVGVSSDGSSNQMNGYIDDLRITKGYARYTANFTPPTAALPVY